MTHYRFDNKVKKQSASWTKIAVVCFGVLAGFFILFFILAPFLRDLIRGPQWLHGTAVDSLSQSAGMITPKKDLLAQIDALKNSLQEKEAQLIELQMLRDENTALRTELSYPKNSGEVLLAGVIAKPSQSLYNSIIIDRGERDGIFAGQLVTTQGAIALGQIASVTARTATITLFSGPQFDGDVIIKGQNITVPATGKGGGNFEIHIPREIEVLDGDLLALPQYPDLAIGVVKSVQFDPRDPFQTVLARTPINIQELRFVEVVK